MKTLFSRDAQRSAGQHRAPLRVAAKRVHGVFGTFTSLAMSYILIAISRSIS